MHLYIMSKDDVLIVDYDLFLQVCALTANLQKKVVGSIRAANRFSVSAAVTGQRQYLCGVEFEAAAVGTAVAVRRAVPISADVTRGEREAGSESQIARSGVPCRTFCSICPLHMKVISI